MRILTLLLIIASLGVKAQKLKVDSGSIKFFSEAPLENIEAKSDKLIGAFDLTTGDIAFIVSIADFTFDNSLMQEHFNEKYMETEKYPRSTFTGKMTGYSKEKTGEQTVRVNGKLTIHGITKEITVTGEINILSDGKIKMESKFPVALEDYNIDRPQILWQNIAEEVEVDVELLFMIK